MEIVNAKIENTMLGFEGHRILTAFLYLDYGTTQQGFGGYSLGGEHTDRWVRDILKTLEVEKWEDLKGINIRVKREDGWNGRILEIGHYLKDNWFKADINK